MVRGRAISCASVVSVRGDVYVFGRCGRRRYEFAVLLDQVGHTEFGRTLQCRIIPFQRFHVAGEEPMLPYVGREPCTSEWPVRPVRIAFAQTDRTCHGPYVRIVSQRPSLADSVIVLRGSLSGRRQVAYEAQKHLMHLGKSGRLGSPVILFKIDVCGIVRAPWRYHIFVPKALKIGRNPFGARRRYEQITSILEIQGFQLRI